jgi:hypothetical protein
LSHSLKCLMSFALPCPLLGRRHYRAAALTSTAYRLCPVAPAKPAPMLAHKLIRITTELKNSLGT